MPWRRKWQSTPVLFAWRIPWTEEPDGLQFMGSKKSDMATVSYFSKCHGQGDPKLHSGRTLSFWSTLSRVPLAMLSPKDQSTWWGQLRDLLTPPMDPRCAKGSFLKIWQCWDQSWFSSATDIQRRSWGSDPHVDSLSQSQVMGGRTIFHISPHLPDRPLQMHIQVSP